MKPLILFFPLFLLQSVFAQYPSIKVIDTDFSKGRLIHQQVITLNDAEKLHGHLCDGLAMGFISLQQALYTLYPDSVIDRTNTRIISKSSPCLADIGIFLSGGRYQYNSFRINDSMPYLFIAQRIDNGKAVAVQLNAGIKPQRIDEMGKLAIQQKLNPCQLEELKQLEEKFTQQLLSQPPKTLFTVIQLTSIEWPNNTYQQFLKTDILNKSMNICIQN
jgi:formylmethanofuran dehydrogenase subunit E